MTEPMGGRKYCVCCDAEIVVMAYRGTGYCSERCLSGKCKHDKAGDQPHCPDCKTEVCHYGCGT